VSAPRETPFFFDGGRGRLFGFVHLPPEDRAVRATWVFCYPFAEEKLWVHRVFVGFARRLAARGEAVLRFDYFGEGDSDGEFAQADLDSRAADVDAAIAVVRERTGGDAPLRLLGIRLGATLAASAAERAARCDRLVLWEPIVRGETMLQDLVRANLATQLSVYREVRTKGEEILGRSARGETFNVDGYEIVPAVVRQLQDIDLTRTTGAFEHPVLIANARRAPGPFPAEFEALAARYPRATLVSCREQPFWKEIRLYSPDAPELYAATEGWLSDLGGKEDHP